MVDEPTVVVGLAFKEPIRQTVTRSVIKVSIWVLLSELIVPQPLCFSSSIKLSAAALQLSSIASNACAFALVAPDSSELQENLAMVQGLT